MKLNALKVLGSLAILSLGLLSATKLAASEPAKTDKPGDPKCPIMGGTVNLAVSTPTDDGPVFFCCPGCIGKYTAAPTKFADVVAAQRKILADRPKVQVKCPVTGEQVDPQAFIEKDGKKIFFCCKGCIPKYEADPAKYKNGLANSYTYQTKCPVSGEAIDARTSVTLPDGEMIYTSGTENIKKLIAEPSKYTANLAQMGYTFDAAKIAKGVPSEKQCKDKEHEGGKDH